MIFFFRFDSAQQYYDLIRTTAEENIRLAAEQRPKVDNLSIDAESSFIASDDVTLPVVTPQDLARATPQDADVIGTIFTQDNEGNFIAIDGFHVNGLSLPSETWRQFLVRPKNPVRLYAGVDHLTADILPLPVEN